VLMHSQHFQAQSPANLGPHKVTKSPRSQHWEEEVSVLLVYFSSK